MLSKLTRSLKKIKAKRILVYLLVILLLMFTALPLVYLVVTAFKPLNELMAFPPKFFVSKPTFSNFSNLFTALSATDVPFLRYALNSISLAVITVVSTIFVCSFAAFGFVKHRPKGANIIMSIIISALMFSAAVMQIPSYIIISKLGLVDSYAALILPKIAVAYNFFLMVQFMGNIPDSFLESSRLDGAGELKIFWKIVMPLLKPAWATLIVFSFVSVWNDFSGPLIYITQEQWKTLPLLVQKISGGTGAATLSRMGAAAAATFVMTTPTIVVFTLMQRKVIETMAYSGIKG